MVQEAITAAAPIASISNDRQSRNYTMYFFLILGSCPASGLSP
jgi:hypothetical protein